MADYLGKNIPKLGFGLMRLPMVGDQVDMPQTKAMVDKFLAAGFTYFDTAYGYLDGKSEIAAKEALVDRYPREAFQLATKLPAFAANTAQQAKDMLTTSLKRTGAGYFDFYLLHNLGDDRTAAFDQYGIWDYVLEQREKGVLKHVGFSFHDKAEVLDQLLTQHPQMEFVQLQVNWADWHSPTVQSAKCMEVARRHGKPVVIMEPVKGGSLAALPESVAQVLRQADAGASLPSWSLRFAASQPQVVTVLSGMSTLAQMEDNIATMAHFTPLTDAENQAIDRAREVLSAIPNVPCTGCQYCVKGCPMDIAIPGIFSAMNNRMVYGNQAGAQGNYNWETRKGGVASKCIACGQCESVCPQHIAIIDTLRQAAEWFEAR